MNRESAISLDLAPTLRSLASPDLDPIFRTPQLIGKPSAWWAHVPFAFWIVAACKPRQLVELGTHNGVSYAAFCEAVVRERLATRCFAVDSWQGDKHAGIYGDQVYGELRSFHDKHYRAFSELLRCTFDEASVTFPDTSIDLLHIDGLHTYEAVRHDFETWQPKLSERGVVLFHDTNVRERDFGVYKFFAELRDRYPSFEFMHGFGLGVVAVGAQAPSLVQVLCALSNEAEVHAVRERFAHLGERWFVTTREQLGAESVGPQIAAAAEARVAEVANESQRALAEAEAKAAEIVNEKQLALTKAEAKSRVFSKLRDRAAQATVGLRRTLEEAERRADRMDSAITLLRQKIKNADEDFFALRGRLADLARRYATAYDDPTLRMKSRLRRRVRLVAARLHVGSLRVHDLHAAEVVRRSVLFDRTWYNATYVDVAAAGVDPAEHYVRFGAAEGREPSPWFSGKAYLEKNPDVAATRANPLLHYIEHGYAEGRTGGVAQEIRGIESLLISNVPVGALRRDLQFAETVRNSVFFDENWYVSNYPEVGTSGIDPAEHYVRIGASEGYDPGPLFSTRSYLEKNADVAAAKANPLLHYLEHGRYEGRAGGLRNVPTLGENTHLVYESASTKRAAQESILFISGEPDSPGHLYRVARYAEAAQRNGYHTHWLRADQLEGELRSIDRYDFLIIWRAPWSPAIDVAIKKMHANGRKVVFDVDDLMIDPALADHEIIDGIRSQFLQTDGVRALYDQVRRTMLATDVCFATTQEMAFHMRWAGMSAHVLPNGFDQATHNLSRQVAGQWKKSRTDEIVRIGYAGGSRTHQRDLGLAINALAKVLSENNNCRLVLFRSAGGLPLIDIEEYPAFASLQDRIEWRLLQPLNELPREMARFDINIAPLEFGNPFCEAKSELKFFEAALVDVPTIASPTGPFRRAIEHGRTGYLAATADDWYFYLNELVHSPARRAQLAHDAYHAVLARFGPLQRAAQFGRVLDQLHGGMRGARGFALEAQQASRSTALPRVFPSDVVFAHDKLGAAEVTVIIPLYNYEQYIVEALESVAAQTLRELDLVVIDGGSTDRSLDVASEWASRNAERFNRIVVLKNQANYGLGFCRNSGFDAADTPYVLPLDADNRLLPKCCEVLLETIRLQPAAYVYPTIQHFGASTRLIGNVPYDPQRFVAGNYVDAMALVAKEAWAIVGGYDHVRHGWEDYDFWCRLAEAGQLGYWKNEPLAEYRVHPDSMMTIQTTVPENYKNLHRNFSQRHPWVSLVDVERFRDIPPTTVQVRSKTERSRLDMLLPLLRCPRTGQKLARDASGNELLSVDGLARWAIVEGRPVLAPNMATPEIKPVDHVSNSLSDKALEVIQNTQGWVLNLSGGGTSQKFDHVVEVEYSIFRHTDLVSDAHVLPFDDNSFDAAIVMNAFEHYREPDKVAAELRRVLKPGGRLLIHTAFMQPLHERPWHFFNCTRHGLEQWFRDFDVEVLHVSPNFCPNHTLAWLASEAEAALRVEVSKQAGDAFNRATLGELVDIWRDPSKRDVPLWNDFTKLSQPTQEIMAAGFEFVGRKPVDRPDLSK